MQLTGSYNPQIQRISAITQSYRTSGFQGKIPLHASLFAPIPELNCRFSIQVKCSVQAQYLQDTWLNHSYVPQSKIPFPSLKVSFTSLFRTAPSYLQESCKTLKKRVPSERKKTFKDFKLVLLKRAVRDSHSDIYYSYYFLNVMVK